MSPVIQTAMSNVNATAAVIPAVGRALADDGKRILVLTPDELLA